MNVILYIRKSVLKASQVELATIAGVSQGTVSKWEAGELEPDRGQLAKIRDHVTGLGLDWSDSWFFDAPPASPARPHQDGGHPAPPPSLSKASAS